MNISAEGKVQRSSTFKTKQQTMREERWEVMLATHCSGVVASLDVVDDLLLVLADDILGCSSPQPGNISSPL